MKAIYNNIIPFRGFAAINLFGILFVRKNVILTDRIISHEKIHTAQMRELWYIFFYVWYGIEWLLKLFKHGLKSYYNLSFEREAYRNENNPDYLNSRKKFDFLKYL
jgi:hypothetical protein